LDPRVINSDTPGSNRGPAAMKGGVLQKASLRSYAVFLFLTLFAALIVYIVLRADVELKISGSIDASSLLTVLVSIVMVVVGWLFGRRST